MILKKRRGKSTPRIDVETQETSKSGIAGYYEFTLRKFNDTVYLATLMPLYLVACFCLACGLAPAIFFVKWTMSFELHNSFLESFFLAISLAMGFFIYGFSMILVIPFVNFLFRAYPQPWRGPYYSTECVPWYIHNGLTYLMRYTFLEFITPTPFNHAFYKLMGMKIGHKSQINTTNISDPSLITLEDRVTIGGNVTIIAHYGMAGFLIIAPVLIKSRSIIGLRAIIMGGVEIGEGAKILPNSVVLPKTIVPDGETWGGVPAKRIDKLD